MSAARKCDGSAEGWSDVDLCEACSKPLLDHLRPALNDLDSILAR